MVVTVVVKIPSSLKLRPIVSPLRGVNDDRVSSSGNIFEDDDDDEATDCFSIKPCFFSNPLILSSSSP